MLAAKATRLASCSQQPCCCLSRGGPASTSTPSPLAAATAAPRRREHHHRRRFDFASAASSSSSSSSPEPSDASPSPSQSSSSQITLAEAHAALGVAEGSKFDLVAAKNRALAEAKGDGEKLAKIELAYDKLLMHSMARRLSGEAPVEASVRYADLRVPPRRGPGSGNGSPTGTASGGGGGSRGVRGGGGGTGIKRGARSSSSNTKQISLGSLPIALATPPPDLASKQALAFGGLAAWALAQGITEPVAAAAVDTASLQLAASLGLSIWFLADAKRLPLRTAALVSLAALAVGAVAGGGLAAWLRPDIVPLGPLASPGVLAAEAAIAALWAAAAFVV